MVGKIADHETYPHSTLHSANGNMGYAFQKK